MRLAFHVLWLCDARNTGAFPLKLVSRLLVGILIWLSDLHNINSVLVIVLLWLGLLLVIAAVVAVVEPILPIIPVLYS